MLFKTTEELRQFSAIQDCNLPSVSLTLKHIEKTVLTNVIGADLYFQINEAYNSNVALDEAEEKLLELCRLVVGPLFAKSYSYEVGIQLSDAGTQRTETTNDKTAYAYQVSNFREDMQQKGEAACEALLEYLYTYQDFYPIWTSSNAYKKYQNLFIKTGAEFNEMYTTPQPYRLFEAIRFKMQDVEELQISDVLTPALYKDLKAKDKNNLYVWSDEETLLLFYIKKAIAYLSVSFAVPHLNIKIDDNGVTVVSDYGVVDSKDKQPRKAAPDNNTSHLIRSCNDAATQYLGKAKKYIEDNATAFAAWKKPAVIELPSSGNDELGGVFGLV